VPRDYGAAYKWYLVSAAVKLHPIIEDDERCREDAQLPVLNLADIQSHLSPAQLAAAQAEANAWLAAHHALVTGPPPVSNGRFYLVLVALIFGAYLMAKLAQTRMRPPRLDGEI
jgi:hypothetical protein